MPVGGGQNELQKKRSQKKRTVKQKSKSKQRILEKNQLRNPIKSVLDLKQDDLSNLTPENLTSLRWEYVLSNPIQENDRIEQYKELRRQRYIDARQLDIQTLVEQMKITI